MSGYQQQIGGPGLPDGMPVGAAPAVLIGLFHGESLERSNPNEDTSASFSGVALDEAFRAGVSAESNAETSSLKRTGKEGENKGNVDVLPGGKMRTSEVMAADYESGGGEESEERIQVARSVPDMNDDETMELSNGTGAARKGWKNWLERMEVRTLAPLPPPSCCPHFNDGLRRRRCSRPLELWCGLVHCLLTLTHLARHNCRSHRRLASGGSW